VVEYLSKSQSSWMEYAKEQHVRSKQKHLDQNV